MLQAVVQLVAVLLCVIYLTIEPDILWFVFRFLGYNGRVVNMLEEAFSKIIFIHILKDDYTFRFFSEGVPFISIYM